MTIDAQRLDRPMDPKYLVKGFSGHAGIRKPELVSLMNELFGPDKWDFEIHDVRIVSNLVKEVSQDRCIRYVVGMAIGRIKVNFNGQWISREQTGTSSTITPFTPPNANKAGDAGYPGIERALNGASTNALKRSAYLIGRATGSEISTKSAHELFAGHGDAPGTTHPRAHPDSAEDGFGDFDSAEEQPGPAAPGTPEREPEQRREPPREPRQDPPREAPRQQPPQPGASGEPDEFDFGEDPVDRATQARPGREAPADVGSDPFANVAEPDRSRGTDHVPGFEDEQTRRAPPPMGGADALARERPPPMAQERPRERESVPAMGNEGGGSSWDASPLEQEYEAYRLLVEREDSMAEVKQIIEHAEEAFRQAAPNDTQAVRQKIADLRKTAW